MGRERRRAVMGQFSGGCYLSFGILVLLGSQVPATLARGKHSTNTLLGELNVFYHMGVSQSSRINSREKKTLTCLCDRLLFVAMVSVCLAFEKWYYKPVLTVCVPACDSIKKVDIPQLACNYDKFLFVMRHALAGVWVMWFLLRRLVFLKVKTVSSSVKRTVEIDNPFGEQFCSQNRR